MCFPSDWRLQVFQICYAKMVLSLQIPSSRFRKMFPTGSELCKVSPRSHYTIPLEENSGKNVPWGLLLDLFLPQLDKITLSDDFVALISKGLCFRKCKYLSKVVGIRKREMSSCAFISGIRVQTPGSQEEMPLALSFLAFHSLKECMFPSILFAESNPIFVNFCLEVIFK